MSVFEGVCLKECVWLVIWKELVCVWLVLGNDMAEVVKKGRNI